MKKLLVLLIAITFISCNKEDESINTSTTQNIETNISGQWEMINWSTTVDGSVQVFEYSYYLNNKDSSIKEYCTFSADGDLNIVFTNNKDFLINSSGYWLYDESIDRLHISFKMNSIQVYYNAEIISIDADYITYQLSSKENDDDNTVIINYEKK